MKKFLGILLLGQLFFSNANALPKWIGKKLEVCRVNQDLDLSMNWKEDDGSWEVEEFSLKKGGYITINQRKDKNQKWYVASNNVFPKTKYEWGN